MTSARAAEWLAAHAEDHVGRAADFNQYWYSAGTISTILNVVRENCLQQQHSAHLDVAFISTPSLFFALTPSERAKSRLLDFDAELGTDEPNFVLYDYRRPTELPDGLAGAFACIIIDPPFITRDVWEQYIATAKLMLVERGLLVLTTVLENAEVLASALGVHPNTFLPSIPNLPYQYALYTNFHDSALDVRNEEVADDPAEFLANVPLQPLTSSPDGRREAPLRGAGSGAYDFDAMVEAELARQQQPPPQ